MSFHFSRERDSNTRIDICWKDANGLPLSFVSCLQERSGNVLAGCWFLSGGVPFYGRPVGDSNVTTSH